MNGLIFSRTSKHPHEHEPHENTETHNDKSDFGILDEEIEDDYWEDPEDDPDVADIRWFWNNGQPLNSVHFKAYQISYIILLYFDKGLL